MINPANKLPSAAGTAGGAVLPVPRPVEQVGRVVSAGVVPGEGRAREGGSSGQPAAGASYLDSALTGLVGFFTSLRLTVVCLALGLVLVFVGTMAQDPLGLYLVQEKFFRSFFVSGPAMWAAIKKTLQMLHVYLPPSTTGDVLLGSRFPVFPGGYLIGGVLVINLIASQLKGFKFSRDKIGLWMVHIGLILLLLGQLLTDRLSRESTLHLREGEARNYSESDRQAELAVIDTTSPGSDRVVAIPQGMLMNRREIQPPELPFALRLKRYLVNSSVESLAAKADTPPAATEGIGSRDAVRELPRVTEMDKRDVPSAVVEVVTPQGSLGTWLVSEYIDQPQTFFYHDRTYQMALRPRRFYQPYSLQLLNFRHDVYPGTDIPKNFSSRVLLRRPDTGENREVLIYMNSPLRYAGETYYQAGYDPDDHGTILQVVHNPSWLTPYFACVLVGLGLTVQFMTHLFGFASERRAA